MIFFTGKRWPTMSSKSSAVLTALTSRKREKSGM